MWARRADGVFLPIADAMKTALIVGALREYSRTQACALEVGG